MPLKFTQRQKKYHQLSTALAYLDNEQLLGLLDDSAETTLGWGKNQVILLQANPLI